MKFASSQWSWPVVHEPALHYAQVHPKTLFEIAMALSTNSGSFPSNSHVSATFSKVVVPGKQLQARCM